MTTPFLNSEFETVAASGRPGEAEDWTWTSAAAGSMWAEFNATDPVLIAWLRDIELFAVAWNDVQDWLDALDVDTLEAAIFNAASPTYRSTVELFAIWDGPNWIESPTFIGPWEETPPTGFSGWYDAAMGTHVAPLEYEMFAEGGWGTDPFGAGWCGGLSGAAIVRGRPLTFPVTIPTQSRSLVMWVGSLDSVARADIAAGVYADAAALAAAVDAALSSAIGSARTTVCVAYSDAGGAGIALAWDGLTRGAESIWLGRCERLRWHDVRAIIGLDALGDGGGTGAFRFPVTLMAAVPSGYASTDVFAFDPCAQLAYYTAWDAELWWHAVPYGMLEALFDAEAMLPSVLELFRLDTWYGAGAEWVDELVPAELVPAMFDGGSTDTEFFDEARWPDWAW